MFAKVFYCLLKFSNIVLSSLSLQNENVGEIFEIFYIFAATRVEQLIFINGNVRGHVASAL